MKNQEFVIAAYSICSVSILGYLAWLSVKFSKVKQQLQELQEG
ncbi:MAG: CcmD family protein [bacterium]|jgi:CcmD family protein